MKNLKPSLALACSMLFLLVLTTVVFAQPGTITTVAGTGMAGFSGDGGPATAAQLNEPQGVALDVAGNLYIDDSENQRVRKVKGVPLCEIIDPVVAIDDAIRVINGDKGLDFGTALTLEQKLEEAKDEFSLGDLQDARSDVSDFVAELEEAVDDGVLPIADANLLLNRASCILAAIQFP